MARQSKVRNKVIVEKASKPIRTGNIKCAKAKHKLNQFLPENEKTEVKIVNQGVSVYDNTVHPFAVRRLFGEHGFTRAQAARVFGITLRTLDLWSVNNPDFKVAMHEGRDAFDTENVEQMLLKRAMGFEYREISKKSVKLKGRNKVGDLIFVPGTETTESIKYMPPETKAATFWLTNRNKERWQLVHKIKAEIESHTSHTELKVEADLSKMSMEQLRNLRTMVSQSASDDGKVIPVECVGHDSGDDTEKKQLEHFMEAAYELVEDEENEEEKTG